MAGIFPLAGFWSKDEILLDAFSRVSRLFIVLLILAAFLTAFYMGRQIWMVFFGKPRHAAAATRRGKPEGDDRAADGAGRFIGPGRSVEFSWCGYVDQLA